MDTDDVIKKFSLLRNQDVVILAQQINLSSDSEILWCTDTFAANYDTSREALAGTRFYQFFEAKTSQETVGELKGMMEAGQPFVGEFSFHKQDGDVCWVELSFSPLESEGPDQQLWSVFSKDITLLRERESAAEQALKQQANLQETLKDYQEKFASSEQRLWNAIQALPDAFVMYDDEDRLVICNEQYRQTYNDIADVIVPGQKFETILRTALDRGAYPEAVGCEEEWLANRLAQHNNPVGAIEQELPGDRYLKIHESRTSNGDIVGFRVDITDIKRQQRRLEKFAKALEEAKARIQEQALHDPLTGLANRRCLDDYLVSACETCMENGQELSLLHVDLDRFKQINDTFGHAAGDFILVHVATVLRQITRDGDLVARIGGDEFVVVCQGPVDMVRPAKIADRIVQELSKPINFEGRPCRVGASVGIAYSQNGTVGSSDLLINADVALYRAKRDGRNQVVSFSSELQSELVKTKILADEILHGLENEEFIAYFQPQFDAVTHDLVGVETLARWHHPKEGILTPDRFLQVAEELDVVGEIDSKIFHLAVDACERMRIEGVDIPKIAVNVSYRRLSDPRLLEAIDSYGDFGARIAFELLETIFLDEHSDTISWNIDRLRDNGIEIEIDDFGSGRASIVGLTKVAPDRLKIDRQLVIPITQSDQQRSLVEAIIHMGKSLGISVTAEGVETREHAEILRDLGCDTLQGYAFARPMALEDLRAFMFLEAWRTAA